MSCISKRGHEWDFEDQIVEVDAEYIYVVLPCRNAEIIGSQTSERLDETFYEYGAECEQSRHITYKCTDTDIVYEVDDAQDFDRKVEMAAHEEIAAQGRGFDPFTIPIEHNGETYELTFEVDEDKVHY